MIPDVGPVCVTICCFSGCNWFWDSISSDDHWKISVSFCERWRLVFEDKDPKGRRSRKKKSVVIETNFLKFTFHPNQQLPNSPRDHSDVIISRLLPCPIIRLEDIRIPFNSWYHYNNVISIIMTHYVTNLVPTPVQFRFHIEFRQMEPIYFQRYQLQIPAMYWND